MKYLPEQANLEFLRREARVLRNKHRVKDETVFNIIGHYDTSFHGLNQEQVFAKKFSIIDAQRVIARQYCFSSWRRLKLFVHKSSVKTEEFRPDLRQQLLRRNSMRQAIVCRVKKQKTSIEILHNFNAKSLDMLQSIHEKYGYPGPQLVSRDGSDASFFLAMSNIIDSQFQYKWAMLMKEALQRGESFGDRYAVMIDRWLNLSYKPSIYGAFNDFNKESGRVEFSNDVINPKNLNKRRAKVGLANFESENERLKKLTVEKKGPAVTQNEWETRKRQLALEGGYIS